MESMTPKDMAGTNASKEFDQSFTQTLLVVSKPSQEHPGYYEASISVDGALGTPALARDEVLAVAFALRELADALTDIVRSEK